MKQAPKISKPSKGGMSWVLSETVLYSLFIIVTVTGGLVLRDIIHLAKAAEFIVGDILAAFGLLVFFYKMFKASSKEQ